MKKLVAFIFFILCAVGSHSTPQEGDILIYKGDTISIYPFILEYYIEENPDKETIRKKIDEYSELSTACWRGFRALLEIRNDSLFLMGVYGKEELDLSLIFDKKDNIFVDWYTGVIIHPENILIYEHSGWGGYYEYETDFEIDNGILKSVNKYHNQVKPSVYTNQTTLTNYIKTHIDYDNVLPVKDKVRVFLRIDDVDIDGNITEVSVIKGSDDRFNREAIRVVKSIPQWQVIVRRGIQQQIRWYIPVVFDKRE